MHPGYEFVSSAAIIRLPLLLESVIKFLAENLRAIIQIVIAVVVLSKVLEHLLFCFDQILLT